MPAGVALLGTVDRLLRQVVAQHVARVGGVHARAPRCGRSSPSRDARGVAVRASRRMRLGAARLGFVVERVGERRQRALPHRLGETSTSASARKNSVMSTSAACSSACSACMQLDIVVAALAPGRAWRRCCARSARDERVDVALQSGLQRRLGLRTAAPARWRSRVRFQCAICGCCAEAVAPALARRWCSASSRGRSRRASRTARSRW